MDLFYFLFDLFSPGREIIIDGAVYSMQYCMPLSAAAAIAIAAGISALSTGGSALAGASANKKNKAILDELNRENEQRYLQEYYRGALENEGSKAYLKRLDQMMEKRQKAADNAAVATGATHENQLAVKQANNEVLSDAIAGLIEKEENRKEAERDRYFNAKTSLKSGQMSQNQAVAQNWANLGAGISSAAGSLASAYLLAGNYGIDPNAANAANTANTANAVKPA